MNSDNKCPGCLEGHLKTWSELTQDEREVVERLPGAREYSFEERQKMHRWCPRCWYESANHASRV